MLRSHLVKLYVDRIDSLKRSQKDWKLNELDLDLVYADIAYSHIEYSIHLRISKSSFILTKIPKIYENCKYLYLKVLTMVDNIMNNLITEFLDSAYPIKRIRVPNDIENVFGLKPKGNFKRVIKINSSRIYKMSEKDGKYKAMKELSNILCRVFNISHDDTIPILKKHLYIK